MTGKVERFAIEVGKPYLWKSELYGDVAVHVKGFSLNREVVVLYIDGGADSQQAKQFFALNNGVGFSVISSGEIYTRPRRASRSKSALTRKVAAR